MWQLGLKLYERLLRYTVFMQYQQNGKAKKNTHYFKLGMFRHCPKVVSQSNNVVVSLDQHAKYVSFVLLQVSEFQQLLKG